MYLNFTGKIHKEGGIFMSHNFNVTSVMLSVAAQFRDRKSKTGALREDWLLMVNR